MKKIISLAAAVAAASFSLNASALVPWTPGGTTPDLEISISGASAPDKLLRTMIQNICTNDFTEFSYDTNFPSKTYTAYYCTLDTTDPHVSAAGLGALKVLFYKRSAGGSFQGTKPVAASDAIDSLDLSAAANCTGGGGTQYTGCTTLTTRVSDAGTSDLPPDVFIGPNVGSGETACDDACVSALDSAALFQQVFGVPVTNPLYVALQEAQGLDTDVDNNGVNDVEEKDLFKAGGTKAAQQQAYVDNMPSLTKEQVAAFFANNGIEDYSSVKFGGTNLVAAATTAPATNQVILCRRVNGSGTQATFNLNIMNAPLNSLNSTLIATDNTFCFDEKNNVIAACDGFGATETNPLDPASGRIVFENSGSGNVTTCLDNVSDQNGWAMGVQGLEKQSAKWAFIKLDGQAPTLENTAMGNYFHWGASSMQWRKTMPAGDKLTILEVLRGNMADPAELNSANQSKGVYEFGLSGALSLTATPITPFNPVLPVAQFEHPNNKSFQIPLPRDGADIEFK